MARRLLAEFLGTFFLVLFGPGAIMVEALFPGTLGNQGIAIAFGAVVAAMVFTFGPVSGAHINPAVTITLCARRQVTVRQAAAYVAVQLAGAVAASLVTRAALGAVGQAGATVPHVPIPAAFVVEVLMSVLLILVVLQAGETSRVGAAAMVGLAVGLCALVGGPLTGASMNPARSFGPALVSGTWTAHWLYWVAPIAGMLGGARLADHRLE